MLSLNVIPREDRPLTDQIVMGVKRQIDDRQLRPGTRLPSIRNFAETHGVSRFTVVEAYDRLVAMGCLQSRRGAGFYVAAPAARSEGAVPAAPEAHRHNEQLVWLIRRLLEAGDQSALAGGPWLPNSWQDKSGIRQALSALARKNGAHLLEYGNPFGYLPLREHLALTLGDIGIAASPAQILLTQGTSQALDLVMRYLLQPGDCALVDDPGYYNLFGNLRMHGVEMLAVPRRPDGPDLGVLEALIVRYCHFCRDRCFLPVFAKQRQVFLAWIEGDINWIELEGRSTCVPAALISAPSLTKRGFSRPANGALISVYPRFSLAVSIAAASATSVACD